MDQQRPKLAQMMKPILLSSLAALWMSIGAVAWARTNVPEAGLAADRMADGTMRFASTASSQCTTCRADLWVRVADINARLERVADVAMALSRAVEASPDDPHCTSACPRHMRRPMMPWPHNVR